MNNKPTHDWGRIFTFWAAIFVTVILVAGMSSGDFHILPGVLSIATVTIVGSELIGRE